MEVSILSEFEDYGIYTITYRYWETGQCACEAIKIKRTFDDYPRKQDLIDAI